MFFFLSLSSLSPPSLSLSLYIFNETILNIIGNFISYYFYLFKFNKKKRE